VRAEGFHGENQRERLLFATGFSTLMGVCRAKDNLCLGPKAQRDLTSSRDNDPVQQAKNGSR
jgi:hypothetical protein